MKAILSYQNATSNGRDVLVINGEVIEYRGSEEHKEAQRYTMPLDGMKPQKFLAWWFRKNGASSNLRLYYQKNIGVLLVSHLVNTDEANRRMVYTFYSDDVKKPLYVRKLMEDYCSISGVKPYVKDCDAIEYLLKFHKNKNKYVLICGIIIIGIIISIIV